MENEAFAELKLSATALRVLKVALNSDYAEDARKQAALLGYDPDFESEANAEIALKNKLQGDGILAQGFAKIKLNLKEATMAGYALGKVRISSEHSYEHKYLKNVWELIGIKDQVKSTFDCVRTLRNVLMNAIEDLEKLKAAKQ